MPRHVIYTRLSPSTLYARLRELPRVLSGSLPDKGHIARGFRLRLATAFFSKVKQAFIVKSRGGTDEAGIKWKPLSKEYLAYGRRFGKGEQAGLKRAHGLGPANRLAPRTAKGIEGKGLLTKAQLKRWRYVFASNFRRLAVRLPLESAKSHAARMAWSVLKSEGAKTKLEVFGNRKVEILRDTDLLYNSLNPGITITNGPDASYSKRPHQVVENLPTSMLVGTNVEYSGPNHRRRPLWPEADQMPEPWLEYFQETAAAGIPQAIEMLAR